MWYLLQKILDCMDIWDIESREPEWAKLKLPKLQMKKAERAQAVPEGSLSFM